MKQLYVFRSQSAFTLREVDELTQLLCSGGFDAAVDKLEKDGGDQQGAGLIIPNETEQEEEEDGFPQTQPSPMSSGENPDVDDDDDEDDTLPPRPTIEVPNIAAAAAATRKRKPIARAKALDLTMAATQANKMARNV